MITSQNTRITHVANGATSIFGFDFYIVEKSSLHVALFDPTTQTERAQILNVDYTLHGVRQNAGGSITFLQEPPKSGVVVRMVRRTALVQETDFKYNDDFPSETLEIALDREICIAQELSERVTIIEGQIVVIHQRLDVIEADVAALFGEVATLKQRVSALEGRVAALEGNFTALEKYVSELSIRLETLIKSIETIKADLDIERSERQQADQNLAERVTALEQNSGTGNGGAGFIEKSHKEIRDIAAGVSIQWTLAGITQAIVPKVLLNGLLDGWGMTNITIAGDVLIYTPQLTVKNAVVIILYSVKNGKAVGAENVGYDSTASGLASDTVQAALDKLAAQDKTLSTGVTEAKSTANAATTTANQAATTAGQAATAAQAAQTTANQATQNSAAAASAASTAQTTADTASTKADAAQTTANQAKAKADTALQEVIHDASLTGKGTSASPLSVVNGGGGGGLPTGGTPGQVVANTAPNEGEWANLLGGPIANEMPSSIDTGSASWNFFEQKVLYPGDSSNPAFRLQIWAEMMGHMNVTINSISIQKPDGTAISVSGPTVGNGVNSGPNIFDFVLTGNSYDLILGVPFVSLRIDYFIDQMVVMVEQAASFASARAAGLISYSSESEYGVSKPDGKTIQSRNGVYSAVMLDVVALAGTSLTPTVDRYHTASISANTTITLPSIAADNNKPHEIWLETQITGTPTINFGTTRYIGEAPTIAAGFYTFGYVWQVIGRRWVMGWYKNA